MLGPSELELLRLACEALDRAEAARVALDRDGLTQVNRYGMTVLHPLVAVQRDSVIAAARLFRDLHIPDVPDVSDLPTVVRSVPGAD